MDPLTGWILTCIFLTIAVLISFFYRHVIEDQQPYPVVVRYEEERYFENPTTGEKFLFPSLHDDPEICLSVIIPAYNEEKRLPKMLDECLAYLMEKKSLYEVIIVSDGSTDGTVKIALEYVAKYGTNNVRLMNLIKNRGKGGAVRLGVLSARGRSILFADADGATTFSDLDKLVKGSWRVRPPTGDKIFGQPRIAIGSRAHLEDNSIASRSFFRTVLMHGFHFLVWCFTVRGIRDTQCGFKLFDRDSARMCFPNLHIEKWAFDVELLYIAQALNIGVKEVAVNWTEIEGSKVTPIWSWLQMGRDLILIWLRYKLGVWKLITKKE